MPLGSVEGSGDDAVLVIDGHYGFGMKYSEMTDWQRRIEHLGALKLLTVQNRGRDFLVARGPKLKPQRM